MSENDKPALMQAVYRLTRQIQILPLFLRTQFAEVKKLFKMVRE